MVLAKVFIKASEFEGFPRVEDIQLIEEELNELQDGEILVEAEFLSVDPYQRALPSPVGSVMIGAQVGKIVESKHSEYPEGACVAGHFGWRTHSIVNPDVGVTLTPGNVSRARLLPDFDGLSRSFALGALGMPGVTAYFGLQEICQPQPGETLVVTTAAGAVGSLVSQIAKIKGLTVIGITGSDEKCAWLTGGLGEGFGLELDHAINYKTADIAEELRKAAPNGVDCYFDNVGGEISAVIISQMNTRGRIAVCGSITAYGTKPEDWPKVQPIQPNILFKQLKMEGFNKLRWSDRFMEAFSDIHGWIKKGFIKNGETITEGFENMPIAFIEMLNGANVGKAIVRV